MKDHSSKPEAPHVEPSEEKTQAAAQETNNDQWKEQFLRVTADFQNYKRRVEKERFDVIARAQIKVVESILPLLDDLERALTAAHTFDSNPEVAAWASGVKIIEKNLYKVLSDLNVEEISCAGSFNPLYHEALMNVASESHASGEIVEVLSKGYKMGNEIIRHAKVTVAQ